jgi:hypothetical protein
MTDKCSLRISREDFDTLMGHLFPGDDDEHGAVLLAGISEEENGPAFLVREVHPAHDGIDYIEGKIGYRALKPQFIHRLITHARDEKLVYLAVHNHPMCENSVGFSVIDLESHERGYPALLQIARGMPVGALVFGRRSVQADVWLPNGKRLALREAVVVGNTMQRLTPSRIPAPNNTPDVYDRQVRMFGRAGQDELAKCRVGIIGLGGIGSLVAEYTARLGVGKFILVDDDIVEESNLSRIVGATKSDIGERTTKAAVVTRLITEANDQAEIKQIIDDTAKEPAAKALTSCDYLFLAADSMRARLVFNAIIHQYLIPGVQLGSKIRSDKEGTLVEVMSANRSVRPGRGCLWCNQFIDPTQLAKEAKTDEERKAQAYGVEEPNPSVITLNAVSAAHAANDFLLDYLGLRPEGKKLYYEHFHFLDRTRKIVQPRKDDNCSECSKLGMRYASGDSVRLPCIES